MEKVKKKGSAPSVIPKYPWMPPNARNAKRIIAAWLKPAPNALSINSGLAMSALNVTTGPILTAPSRNPTQLTKGL